MCYSTSIALSLPALHTGNPSCPQVFGSNEMATVPPKSLFRLMWENLQDPILLLLIAAALVRGLASTCCHSTPAATLPTRMVSVAVFAVTMATSGARRAVAVDSKPW